MRTSILALALASVAPLAVQAQSPNWQTDYATAYRQATVEQRPLAMIFGKGAEGWRELVGGGSLTSEANRALSNNYVPCYVDTTTPQGKAVAQAFGVGEPVGIVLSDRTGKLQAFRHEGTLSADALDGYLTKYADPERVTVTTDTNPPVAQASYYPPAQAFAPAAFAPSFGFAGGGMACSS